LYALESRGRTTIFDAAMAACRLLQTFAASHPHVDLHVHMLSGSMSNAGAGPEAAL
jgi:hypothetical protein